MKTLKYFILAIIAALLVASRANALSFVSVGDTGNSADTNGFGAVDYHYRISK